MWRTLKNSGPALGLITTFTIVISFLVGSLIYYFEAGTFKASLYEYNCIIVWCDTDRSIRGTTPCDGSLSVIVTHAQLSALLLIHRPPHTQ